MSGVISFLIERRTMDDQIYVVAATNFSPPEVNSVWSTPWLALARRDKLTNEQHGAYKTFVEEVDSGKFELKNELK